MAASAERHFLPPPTTRDRMTNKKRAAFFMAAPDWFPALNFLLPI
jgi:hypothetical protein